jgi:transcription elongation factor Elf1
MGMSFGQMVVNTGLRKRGGEKVAKCPYCGKEIEYLVMLTTEVWMQEYHPEKPWTMRKYMMTKNKKFSCPHCNKIICEDEHDARKILSEEK